MSYIGNQPSSVAFLTDTFSGNGSTTSFTLSVAPAGTSSILVAVSGVLQDPSTYAVVGTALNFTGAPPSGTGNISVRYLGVPASGITTAAYRTVTEFTATAGQTVFSTPSYTPGFIDVYRNGVMLGSADYTATNGTTVVLATGATAGDLIETISFYVSSVYNALANTAGSVNANNIADGAVGTPEIADGAVTAAKLASGAALSNLGTAQLSDANMAPGSVIQVVQSFKNDFFSTTSTTPVDVTGLSVTITPSSTSSKILVMVNAMMGGAQDTYPYLLLLRNGSVIANGTGGTGNQINTFLGAYFTNLTTTQYAMKNVSNDFLDSPNTTSALTYKIQMATPYNPYGAFTSINRQQSNLNDPYIQYTTSSITVMEIAG